MNKLLTIAVLSLGIALVAGITTSTIMYQAFAAPKFNAQDDKNNPTAPGGQDDKDHPDNSQSGHASDNNIVNCIRHGISEKGAPAQCYNTP